MVALENLRIALQSLLANPLRSLLTLIGIAVGIGAVLHVVSLGRITQQRDPFVTITFCMSFE